ncbi:glutaminyl-peptide cyclotransferase [Pseudonocardiaceae bacterium YIM PH 21723]|nr:glutaminyl-peptide cyclotransferase [Pseudonocardiaceae bacterium YIM PH 21723]
MLRVCALTIAGLLLAACAPATGGDAPRLRPEVLETRRHDPSAFTQGLDLRDDQLFEGTGLVGDSRIVRGADTVRLPGEVFGEGVAVVGAELWQLTWQDGIAFRRSTGTLAELGRVRYDGEGWGLCYQPSQDRLIMSDGSSRLTFRDPRSFAVLGSVETGVSRLNELDCAGDVVWANVWQTDEIVRIDPGSGRVTAVVDASGLPEPARSSDNVLNGIAAIPGTDEFWLTGKRWTGLYRVRFVPVDLGESGR